MRVDTSTDDEVQEAAKARHAVNVLISEFDWQRALEAVRVDGLDSVSDVVRLAIAHYLDHHPAAAVLNECALDAIQFELTMRKRRQAYARAAKISG